MARLDDDALSWGGDDDPTLDVGVPATPPPTGLPKGYTAVGRGSEATVSTPAGATPDADATPGTAAASARAASAGATAAGSPAVSAAAASPAAGAPAGNATLVSLGVLGGIYLLLAVGWFIGGSRLQFVAQLFLDSTGYVVTWGLAVLAPVIWFGTVFFLTRGGRTWVRMLLLIVGAIVLLPWPFLLVGVGA
ncbi:DNA polymerase III subunit gamma/tau [Microbacterium sp. cx-59]|uniref:DNA polymerase III subunit gamma/tau n=1 Tax=Microbacterium sp. cx-59 TaxID=2891207 RepID=UPI001E610099|nr:DNA polymerase III subunit gamma/tau [Microbacterium sp. cx-59]MCC4907052.1 DNA polymerase III subunit gamma/tau [Microbacterium sp. cx-59]